MIVRELFTTWGFDIDFRNLNKMDKKISDIARGTGKLGRRFQAVTKKARDFGVRGSAFLSAPLAILGATTLRAAGDFEEGMNRVNALTQATNDEFKKLQNQARELGGTTQFTAKESADAMAFLAQAGLDTTDIFKAMPDALNLAGAAQIDFATTADIVTNIMTGMGVESDDLGGVVDVLTKAFISSNTNLQQLGEAMKFAGPVASSFGLSLNDTVAILGKMGDAGIQASMAGTSLRTALARLAKGGKPMNAVLDRLGVTTKNSQGELRNLVDILGDLEKAGADATDIITLFDVRAGPSLIAAMKGGVGAIREFSKELGNSGGLAKKLNQDQLKGLNGALKSLISRWEALQISIGNAGLLEFSIDTVKAITKLVDWMGGLSETTLAVVTVFTALLAISFPLLFLFGSLGFAVIGLSQGYLLLKAAIVATRTAIILMQGAFFLIPILIALAIAGVILFVDELIKWGSGNESIIGKVLGNWEGFSQTFKNVMGRIGGFFTKQGEAFVRIAQKIGNTFIWLGEQMAAPFINMARIIDNLIGKLQNKFPIIKSITDKISGLFSGAFGFLGGGETANAPPVTPETVARAATIPVNGAAGATTTNAPKSFVNSPTVNITVEGKATEAELEETAEKLESIVDGINQKMIRKTKNELMAAP